MRRGRGAVTARHSSRGSRTQPRPGPGRYLLWRSGFTRDSPEPRGTWMLPANTKLEHLDRRNWWMWGTAFVLILSLTAAIPAIHSTALQLVGLDEEPLGKGGYEALVGLVGLVSLFILYIILKQRELQTM